MQPWWGSISWFKGSGRKYGHVHTLTVQTNLPPAMLALSSFLWKKHSKESPKWFPSKSPLPRSLMEDGFVHHLHNCWVAVFLALLLYIRKRMRMDMEKVALLWERLVLTYAEKEIQSLRAPAPQHLANPHSLGGFSQLAPPAQISCFHTTTRDFAILPAISEGLH